MDQFGNPRSCPEERGQQRLVAKNEKGVSMSSRPPDERSILRLLKEVGFGVYHVWGLDILGRATPEQSFSVQVWLRNRLAAFSWHLLLFCRWTTHPPN